MQRDWLVEVLNEYRALLKQLLNAALSEQPYLSNDNGRTRPLHKQAKVLERQVVERMASIGLDGSLIEDCKIPVTFSTSMAVLEEEQSPKREAEKVRWLHPTTYADKMKQVLRHVERVLEAVAKWDEQTENATPNNFSGDSPVQHQCADEPAHKPAEPTMNADSNPSADESTPLFTYNVVAGAVGLSESTIRKIARLAGTRKNNRGQTGFKFTLAEIRSMKKAHRNECYAENWDLAIESFQKKIPIANTS